jgi:hypothetical protein
VPKDAVKKSKDAGVQEVKLSGSTDCFVTAARELVTHMHLEPECPVVSFVETPNFALDISLAWGLWESFGGGPVRLMAALGMFVFVCATFSAPRVWRETGFSKLEGLGGQKLRSCVGSRICSVKIRGRCRKELGNLQVRPSCPVTSRKQQELCHGSRGLCSTMQARPAAAAGLHRICSCSGSRARRVGPDSQHLGEVRGCRGHLRQDTVTRNLGSRLRPGMPRRS